MRQIHVFHNRSIRDNKTHNVTFIALCLSDDPLEGYQEVCRSTFFVPAHQKKASDTQTICETVLLEACIKLKLPADHITINIYHGGK